MQEDGAASPMRLNYDVLIATMAFSGRSDIWRLMCTCRTLYQAGVPNVLHGTVKISLLEQLTSLYEFLNHDPHRSRYFLSLDVKSYHLTHDTQYDASCTTLVALLSSHAQHLSTISVTYGVPLFADQHLQHTLSTIHTLRNMKVHGYSKDLSSFFRQIQRPIEKLDISFEDYWLGITVDATRMCAPLKDSLEALLVERVKISAAPHIQYPHLTTLHIGFCKHPQLEDIIPSFPNLRNLCFWVFDNNRLSDPEIEVQRAHNNEAQKRARWDSLRSVAACVRDLFLLGIQCRVDHLDIRSRWLDRAADGPMLLDIISNMHPSTLQIRLQTPGFETSRLGEFLSPAKGRLATLTLNLTIHALDYSDPGLTLVSSSCHKFNFRGIHRASTLYSAHDGCLISYFQDPVPTYTLRLALLLTPVQRKPVCGIWHIAAHRFPILHQFFAHTQPRPQH